MVNFAVTGSKERQDYMQNHKRFNTTGVCIPKLHYMVDISAAVEQIVNEYISNGEYFTINRARQFGKTTLLEQLHTNLKQSYIIIYISFESADDCFVSLYTFAQGFVNKVARALEGSRISKEASDIWSEPISRELPIDSLNQKITNFCKACDQEVILMIDEVDKSSDNQIFLSFLGLLREKYLARTAGRDSTFQSVILAGVYDIKNLKLKLRPGEEIKYNSPWNVAADFTLDMSLSKNGIAGMLRDYEQDYHTGMDIEKTADMIYAYTKGYPFLVSYICKRVDEKIAGSTDFPDRRTAWTKMGILCAIRQLVKQPNALYDDMIKHVAEYPELREMLTNILFGGQVYVYHEYDKAVNIGSMFGFVTNKDGNVAVANRIFETQLYDYFLADETRKNDQQREALPVTNQFIVNGQLD